MIRDALDVSQLGLNGQAVETRPSAQAAHIHRCCGGNTAAYLLKFVPK